MLKSRRRLQVAAFGALLAALPGEGALAQTNQAQGNTQSGTVVGPPQLRDFDLGGERRTPPPRTQRVQPAQPAPTERRPAPQAERPATAAPRPAAQPETRRPAESAPRPAVPSQPEDVFQLPAAPVQKTPAPTGSQPAPAPRPPAQVGTSFWLYLVPLALAAIGAIALLRRRKRAADRRPVYVPEPEAAPKPRPDPMPRPWIEIELKAERAASTPDEASVEFEMVIRNTGKSAARNIRLNARLFNAGREQDKEIGAFFKNRGEGRRTHTIPELPAGLDGLIQGNVTMPREEMKALKVNDQLLFIPVIGVNVVYDWGEGRTGQTSKSYVIGRELGEQSEKMGAFRIDLGPRIYRAVGLRQHSLARRV